MLPEPTMRAFLSHVRPHGALLDIGCGNGGALLQVKQLRPDLHLAGVDIGVDDLEECRRRLPDADLRLASGDALPFCDDRFDAVTCLETIEHVPSDQRAAVFAEARRVIVTSGQLLMTTPHRGAFRWLDAQNLRHRLPWLYRFVRGQSDRDRNYAGRQDVVWHHHFTRAEVTQIMAGWEAIEVTYPGLLLVPLVDLLSFPFHRTRRYDNVAYRTLESVLHWEDRRDFGPRAGYGIRVLARMSEPPEGSRLHTAG